MGFTKHQQTSTFVLPKHQLLTEHKFEYQFLALESGILRIRLQGEPARKIRAYAYTAKPGMAHSNANGFYLFDMSTLLDLEIDLHAHMVESKNGKCIPLRTMAARPQCTHTL